LRAFSSESASPAFSFSVQKSGRAVAFSISLMSFLSVSGSKTPPGFFDLGAEGLEFLLELS